MAVSSPPYDVDVARIHHEGYVRVLLVVGLCASCASAPRPEPAGKQFQPIVDTVMTNRHTLKPCVDDWMARTGRTTQKARVHVKVDATGAVRGVGLEAPDGVDAVLETCFTKTIGTWQFPSSTDQYGFTFPVVLQAE